MPEIKLNLRQDLLCLFRYLSAIILNYINQFRKRSNIALRPRRAKFGCLTRGSSTHFTALYAQLSLIP
ncbi:hypothetical protein OTSTA763_0530 [Orientia tsutsugamushi str. TA763]|nr:hypothetical protein OTSTA763_0530 [Orientia tsutsugamushi str. TA763]